MFPRASIIIVNYNAGEKLNACLRSLTQDRHPDDEIIVVDNASTDGSVNGLERAFPDVRFLRSVVNLGFAGGNNLAVQHATGEYLAFLNPDTVATPGWLDALIDALQRSPQIGLATSKILLLKQPDRINTCGNDMHYTGLTLCRGMGMPASSFSEPEEVTAVSGAAFAMRRDLFEQLGGFDETFFLYMEDTDLSLRARLAGYHCRYVPSSVVYHDYTLRFGPNKTFYQERNRYMMLLKALHWRTLAAMLPALLLSEIVTWGFTLLREPRRVGNKLNAYAWVAKHWREVSIRRAGAQALRGCCDYDVLSNCSHQLHFEQVEPAFLTRHIHIVFDGMFCILHHIVLTAISEAQSN